MPDNHFSRKKRQLKRIVKRLNLLLEKKDSKLNIEINKLIAKVNSLLKQLSGLIDGREIRKILGGLIVFFGISFNAEAQNFASPVPKSDIAPYPWGNSYYSAVIDFCDIDNDGDYDLFFSLPDYYYNNTIYFQQNVGSPNSEVFSIPIQNQFNIQGLMDTVNINSQGCVGRFGIIQDMHFVDIDNDGDYDCFSYGLISEVLGPPSCTGDTTFPSIIFYENTGNANNPNFAPPVLNPFGLDAGTLSYYFYVQPIEFVDIDNDGDLDLISVDYSYGNYYFDVVFRENIGSSTSPQFATTANNLAVGPFGTGIYDIEAVDINNDGDFDLFGGVYGGTILYYENSGSSTSPNFSPPATNPFNLSVVNNDDGDGNLNIKFCDIDDDGDEDCFWINPEDVLYHGDSWYYQENISLPSNTNQIYIDENIEIYPNPSNNYITILYDKEIDKTKIYDISGKCILISDDKRINIENLENGIYSLELINKEGITRKKFIKE